jgi:hypothetical protein
MISKTGLAGGIPDSDETNTAQFGETGELSELDFEMSRFGASGLFR